MSFFHLREGSGASSIELFNTLQRRGVDMVQVYVIYRIIWLMNDLGRGEGKNLDSQKVVEKAVQSEFDHFRKHLIKIKPEHIEAVDQGEDVDGQIKLSVHFYKIGKTLGLRGYASPTKNPIDREFITEIIQHILRKNNVAGIHVSAGVRRLVGKSKGKGGS